MNAKNSKKQLKFDRNPIEAIRDSGLGVAKATASALKGEAEEDISRAWKQLLGLSEAKTDTKSNESHDLREGEEFVLPKRENKVNIAPAIDYVSEILHAERRISSEDSRNLNAKIEQLRIEITKLAKSSSELEVVVKDISIESVGPNPGKYHLNFFEWVLATIQAARIRIEDSANWLSSVSTKSQKKGFWNSVKKHGTSYMLSGERAVAQQVG
jgi:hypothetical protein